MPITDALPDMERELKFYPAKNTNPKVLTAEQIDRFNTDGYLCPLDVMTPGEVDRNRAYFDHIMAVAEELD